MRECKYAAGHQMLVHVVCHVKRVHAMTQERKGHQERLCAGGQQLRAAPACSQGAEPAACLRGRHSGGLPPRRSRYGGVRRSRVCAASSGSCVP